MPVVPPPAVGPNGPGSRIPEPDEVIILPMRMVQPLMKIGYELAGAKERWALGGDAGEILNNVAVKADRFEIYTTRAGCDEIWERLAKYRKGAPADLEKKLERPAEVEGKQYPVFIKSRYAELEVEGVKTEVYGDLQFKVGEWEWGDALEWHSVIAYVAGAKVPTVPIRLKSDIYMQLGWIDRALLIGDAIKKSSHVHMQVDPAMPQ